MRALPSERKVSLRTSFVVGRDCGAGRSALGRLLPLVRLGLGEMRRAVEILFGLPAFAWMVRLAAPMVCTDPELALYGQYLVSRRLREMQFEFRFPELRDALTDLLQR